MVTDTLLVDLGIEIRETLHSVMGLMELVREEPLSESQSQCVARSLAGADHLISAANDVLELGQTEAPAPVSDAFDLEAAVTEIASLMQLVAESRNRQLEWSFGPNLPRCIEGDQRLLQDTLRRVMASALGLPAAEKVQMTVSAGVERTLIFEVEAAAGDASANSVESTLALRIVRKRLGHSGGSMVCTVEGGRSVMRMILPFIEAPVAIAATPSLPSAPLHTDASVPPLNLLVAEDSDDSFFLLQAYVVSQGHRLSRAADGAQAVEMVKRGNYDLVFMDVKMPVMDGYTASRLIREWETQQGRPRMPILLLSADEAARQMRLGASVGCSGYLAKPASRAQVLAALSFYARPGEAR